MYRMFKRSNRPTYYIENTNTGEQRSLGTADREEAQRLFNAQIEARQNPAMPCLRVNILVGIQTAK